MVVHFMRFASKKGVTIIAGRAVCGVVSTNLTLDREEVTCKNCLKRLKKSDDLVNEIPSSSPK